MVCKKDIDVLILCGGLGLRLRSIVSDRPKALAEVAGVPFIRLIINYLSDSGFSRFILCTGYKGERIRNYFKHNPIPGIKIVFSQEKTALGTAGALKHAERFIKSSDFLAMNGDTFYKFDLNKFVGFHFKKQALVSMLLKKSKRLEDYGVVKLDRYRKIKQFNEKEYANEGGMFVNAGIYLMKRKLLGKIPKGKEFSLEYDLFPKLKEGAYGFSAKADFIDIGTPLNYKKAEAFLKRYVKKG